MRSKKREKMLRLRKEYKSIEKLLEKNLSTKETEEANRLIASYKEAKKKGIFPRNLLFEIAKWKSQRRAKLCKINSTKTVTKIINETLEMNEEKEKIKHLKSNLWGVGVPVASAILTIFDPQNYGVIDYKVWQILYLYEFVNHKPKGINLSVTDWLQYLELIRRFAKKLNVKARDVDRTLFEYHQKLELNCSNK